MLHLALLMLSTCSSLGLHISIDTDTSKDSPLAQGAQGALGGQAPLCLLQWHCLHHLFLPGEGEGEKREKEIEVD